MVDHDLHYKRMFALVRMVLSLLEAFLSEHALKLDLTTLERVPDSFAGNNRQRYADRIWRVQLKDDPLTSVLLLLEFQSSPHREMAARMSAYAGMCLEEAARQPWGQGPHRVMALPVVVYNGKGQWTAARSMALWGKSAREVAPSYELVDLARLPEYALEGRGPARALARIERAEKQEDFVRELELLAEEFRGSGWDDELRAAFRSWVRAFVAARAPSPEKLNVTGLLGERTSMIAETMKGWAEEWRTEGLAEGLAKGRTEGMAKGMAKGMAEGRAEGRADLAKGLAEHKASLLCIAEAKFGGEVAAELADRLAPVTNPRRLRVVAARIAECATGEELLNRVR